MKYVIYAIFLMHIALFAPISATGKTRKVETITNGEVCIRLQDDLDNTKAQLATDTTCNTFRFLNQCGVPTIFREQVDGTQFRATKSNPILYQVVARREADESFAKRNPHIKKGHTFARLVVEFFLKTHNKKWQSYSLPYDNPYIQFRDGKAYLYNPNRPVWDQEPFLGLDEYPLKNDDPSFLKVIEITARSFLILEKAWQLSGATLPDLKLEFAVDDKGTVMLADAYTDDSWLLIDEKNIVDKHFYSDDMPELKKHRYTRDCTSSFALPKQQIILWRSCEKDDVQPFINSLKPFIGNEIAVTMVTNSVQKDPITAYKNLIKAVHNVPDSVLIAFADHSENTGASLAAQTTIPTIAIPLGSKESPETVWTALRSNTPVMTMLNQEHAALATLHILANRNPRLYALLQMQQMSRLQNIVDM